MKIFISVITILVFVSCGKKSAVNKMLDGSDSLIITFNVPNNDSVVNIVNTTEKKAIRKLSGFLDGKAGELYKCGYDGNMVFYKDGQQLMQVVFRFTEKGCDHF